MIPLSSNPQDVTHADEMLLRWRPEFPILQTQNYLISNSLGAMPRRVYDRMREFADRWATAGVKAWVDEWWDLPRRVGDSIAPLIGAPAGSVSMHTNITTIQHIVLSCFEERPAGRTRIVAEELHFPSVLYTTGAWAKSHAADLVLVPSSDGITVDTQQMVDAIDERTVLVSISHVLFKSAYLHDVKAIAERAHAVGARIVVDAYQSVGVLPVNVGELDVDMVCGGVLKWLCGGPGGAFLYVRPELANTLQPRFTGWFAHARPFAFEVGSMQYAGGAARFQTGTPAIPSLYAAIEGPAIIREVGVERIRAKSVHQTELLIRLADRHGFRVNSPRAAERRGGAVTLDVPHGLAVARAMIERSIIVDYREGAGIRIAPHFYTRDDELTAAIETMKEIIEGRIFTTYLNVSSLVT